MKTAPPILLLALLQASLLADSVPDADPFAFLNDAPGKLDPAAPAKPAEANPDLGLYDRWKKFETSAYDKARAIFPERREIASELLAKKATTLTSAAAAILNKDATTLKALPANTPIELPTKDSAAMALAGFWKCDGDSRWDRTFFQDGLVRASYTDNPWHWVDKTAGILMLGTGFSDVLWMEKPGHLVGMNEDTYKFTMTKSPTQPHLFSRDPITVKLASDESAELLALADQLELKRQALSRYLLAKAAKQADSGLAKKLEENGQHLLDYLYDAHSHPEELGGRWTLGKRALRFAVGGRVLDQSGVPCGTWMWTTASRHSFVIVLDGGKSATDIFCSNAPSDPQDKEMTVRPLRGAKFRASRVLE